MVNFWIRSFPASTTYTKPAPSTAASHGVRRFTDQKLSSMLPPLSYRRTYGAGVRPRWMTLPASAAPPTLTSA